METSTRTTADDGQHVASTASTHIQQPNNNKNKKRAVCQFHPGRVFNKVVLVYQSPLCFFFFFFFSHMLCTHRSILFVRKCTEVFPPFVTKEKQFGVKKHIPCQEMIADG